MAAWLDVLFGGTDKKIERAGKIVRRSTATDEQRKVALEELMKYQDAEAIDSLLHRYDYTTQKTIDDLEEKEQIRDLLISYGAPVTLPRLTVYMKQASNLAWPAQILKALVPEEEYLNLLWELLPVGETIFDEHASRKKLEILQIFKEHKRADIAEKACALLEDRDDEVKLLAIGVLEQQDGQAIGDALVELFKREAESMRIQKRVLDVMQKRNWPVTGIKAQVEKLLPPTLHIAKDGTIKPRGYQTVE